MKTRRLIIGIVVLIVAGAAAFAGVSMTESKVENSVREALGSAGASCDVVRYRLLSNELTLEDVAYTITILGVETSTKIRRVVVNDPDEKALDPATPGRPRVASRITARDIFQKSVSDDPDIPASDGFIEEIVIEDWHQNLGRIVEAYEKDPSSERFFETLLDGSFGRIAYTNYEGKNSKDGLAVDFTVARLTLSDMRDATFSYLAEDLKFSGVVQGGIGSFGVNRMRLPSARLLAVFTDLVRRMDDGNPNLMLKPAEEEALRTLAWEYLRSTPYDKLWLADADFSVQAPGSKAPTKIFSLKRFENALALGGPVRFDMRIEDLFVPDGIRRFRKSVVASIFLNADLRLALAPDSGTSTLALDADLRDFGSVSGNLTCRTAAGTGPADSFMQNPRAWGMNWASRTVFEKGALSFTDKGILPRLAQVVAQDKGMSPSVMLPMLKDEVLNSNKVLSVPGLTEALAVMLDKPGKLTVEMNPAAPVPLGGLAMRFMLDPASLGLRASAEPGSKSLLEALPAGK